jgi:hypothetical protein
MTGEAIPKLFHWIWLGSTPLPEHHRRWIDGWLELHPGWDHVVWTDQNRPTFVNETEFEQSKSFSAKSNVARYELVHRYGGVYIDTDIECLRSIEPLLDAVDAFAVVEEGNSLASCIFGAIPGHRWLADVIERLPGSVATGWGNLSQSGPRFLTAVTAGRSDVTLFAQSFFASPSGSRAHAYTIHHAERSWEAAASARYEQKLRELSEDDIHGSVPPGALFILVGKGIRLEVGGERRYLPFPERNGEWTGYPDGDAAAIDELERLRSRGARFIVFPRPMFYWLEAYPGLADHLEHTSVRVVDNDRAQIFELQPEASHAR